MKEIFSEGANAPRKLGKIFVDKLTRSTSTTTEAEAVSKTEEIADMIDKGNLKTRLRIISGLGKFMLRAIINPESVKIYTDAIRSMGHDDLTGLSNRSRFIAKLESEIQEEGSHAIMMFDLINFSSINNSHGQLVGDNFLKLFANSLRNNFRTSDDPARNGPRYEVIAIEAVDDITASRIGGDEFAVLLKDGDSLNHALLNTLALNKAIAVLSDQELQQEMAKQGLWEFGVRIGTTMFDHDTQSYDVAITKADHKTHTEWSVV